MKSTYFNIHDVVHLQINRPDYCGQFSGLNREYFYFQSNKIKPNLVLNYGPFSPSHTIDKKNLKEYIDYDYFFIEDHFKNIKWSLEILGWETGNFTINFNIQTAGIRRFFPCFAYQNLFLREPVEIQFLLNDYTVLHASAVAKNGNSYIFMGPQHSFKTTLIMHLIRNGFDLVSDDKVIVKDGIAYAFPTNIPSFSFWLAKKRDEDDLLFLYGPRLFLWTIRQLRSRKRIPKIVNQSNIQKIFILTPNPSKTISTCQIPVKTFSEQIQKEYFDEWSQGYMPRMTGIDCGFFYKYVQKYIMKNVKSQMTSIPNKYISVLKTNCKNNLNILYIPNRLDHTSINKIQALCK